MYPEHEKLKTIIDQSQSIGTFLDWLQNDKEYQLCQLIQDCYEPVYTRKENLLAEYFEIDLKKIEKEKQQMIEELRCVNAANPKK